MTTQLLLAACIIAILVVIIFMFKAEGSCHKSRLTNPVPNMPKSEFDNANKAIYTAMQEISRTVWKMSNDKVAIDQPPSLMDDIILNATYYMNAVVKMTSYSDKMMNSELQTVVALLPTMITMIKERAPGVRPTSYPQADTYLPDLIKYLGLLMPNYQNIVNTPGYRAYAAMLDMATANRVTTPEEQQNMYSMFTPLNKIDVIMKKMQADGIKVNYTNGIDMVGYYVYLNNTLANQSNGQFGEAKQNIFQLQSSVLNLIQFGYFVVSSMDKSLPEYSQLSQNLDEFIKYAKLLYGMPVIYTSPPE